MSTLNKLIEIAKSYTTFDIYIRLSNEVMYTDILRNILYSGVWTKFNITKKTKEEKSKKENAKKKTPNKNYKQ